MPTAPNRGPYLRVRGQRPSRIDLDRRYWRRPVGADFIDFLRSLVLLALTPITVPLRLIHRTLTSPLTISLVLKLVLLLFLLLASSVLSVLAVGAFFWSWSTGGPVEVEGWLFYGSKRNRLPHATVRLPLDQILEDLRYDVQVELELVRPNRGLEETDNFMLSLELRSLKNPEVTVISAAQPSLPPPPLPSPFLSLPAFPAHLLPPCVIPWPFRPLCPSRLLGYSGQPNSKIRERRIKGGFVGSARARDVVPLKKDLMEAVMLKPSGGEGAVGSAFVSIGREDSWGEDVNSGGRSKEVKTTGWVVVRFIPRPSGVRWILASHPLPPLLLLPPISLSLTLSSSLFACILITFLRRPKPRMRKTPRIASAPNPTSPESPELPESLEAQRLEKRRDDAETRQQWDEMERTRPAGRGLPLTPETPRRGAVAAVTDSEYATSETETAGVTSTPGTVEGSGRYTETEDGSSVRLTTDDESEGL